MTVLAMVTESELRPLEKHERLKSGRIVWIRWPVLNEETGDFDIHFRRCVVRHNQSGQEFVLGVLAHDSNHEIGILPAKRVAILLKEDEPS